MSVRAETSIRRLTEINQLTVFELILGIMCISAIVLPSSCDYLFTVVLTKSDSDVMFCLQSKQGLIIDRSLRLILSTQVIYRFALTQMECKVSVLLNNCKQNTTSLSLLVGTTVHLFVCKH